MKFTSFSEQIVDTNGNKINAYFNIDDGEVYVFTNNGYVPLPKTIIKFPVIFGRMKFLDERQVEINNTKYLITAQGLYKTNANYSRGAYDIY